MNVDDSSILLVKMEGSEGTKLTNFKAVTEFIESFASMSFGYISIFMSVYSCY